MDRGIMSEEWIEGLEASEESGLGGRVAIVTGASAEGDGMTNGRAAALVLGRRGTKVVCVGRREQQVERTAAMINSQGGEAIALVADVTRPDDCERIVDTAVDTYGRLDFVDNNVGTGDRGTVVTLPIERWRESWQNNVESMILMSKFAIPAMIESAGGGSIVNIGSLRAIRPFEVTPYSATKGAVMALTQAMAVDHAPEGIRVNCIVLGPVYTQTVELRSPGKRELRKGASPLGIEGTAWDTANLVSYLLSDHARFITGECVVLDGGVSLLSPRR
jgi:NAD(P)-dependent dehydrogenase (short-subunit alcohol dehydrogenase family)